MRTAVAETSSDIDFVLLWVDGGDPAWRAKKAKYLPGGNPDDTATGEQRYRDWDLLRYWFRGVETFAPWVRKIFFVTDNQKPVWLNESAPKLVRVNHADFIPPECLPTFSSHAIELNLHRIDGLSERFVYFNDDTFIGRPVKPESFFHNGLPVDAALMYPHIGHVNTPIDHYILNEDAIVTKHFGGRRFMLRNPSKWFLPWRSGLNNSFWHAVFARLGPCPGFFDSHLPYPLLKSTMQAAWAAEPEVLKATSLHKFRELDDVGARLFRKWQFASGTFEPRLPERIGKYYRITAAGIGPLCEAITGKKHNVFCANDVDPLPPSVFNDFRLRIVEAFETVLPRLSSFEKDVT